jgi:hypothetical protein
MSWINLALGLIREAATSEMGQDVLKDIRQARGRETPGRAPGRAQAGDVEAWMRSVEARLGVLDRNMETVVRLLNAQDAAQIRIQKRQRIWNLALGAAWLAAAITLVWLILQG